MRRRLLLVALSVALLAVASPVAARPGGGGSYHGGGGGGGGYRGGGGGFSGVGTGTYGGGGAPMGPVGILVLMGLGGAALLVMLLQKAAQQRALRAQQYGGVTRPRPVVSLAPLQARDPQLTEQSLALHVHPMAEQLRNAWCAGDMAPARAFVSDGVYSRFQVQLGLMRAENRRNVMGDAHVIGLSLEGVEDAAPLDVVHVRLTAQARDTEVPWTATPAEIQKALSKTRIEPYTEIWTLVRCAGAQTKPGDFPVGTACPKCGAPLAGGEMLKCRYCGALVCSGQHDWVLAEITQLEEWHATAGRPPGLDQLRAADPGVAAEVLEDRASYLFWKWVQAARSGSGAPMRKCAAPAFLASGGRGDWAQRAFDVAVGASEVQQVVVGGSDGFDRVAVRVKWSARFDGSKSYTAQQTVLRMARRTGVQSTLSMTALVCQKCGAGLTDSDSTRCDHCNAELAAGDQAWVLEAVM